MSSINWQDLQYRPLTINKIVNHQDWQCYWQLYCVCVCGGGGALCVYRVKQETWVQLSIAFMPLTRSYINHCLTLIPGIATSSVYCDSRLRRSGFPHECHPKKEMTIAVKTHERGRVKTYRRAVLIVRNAHEAILALANFDAAGHTNIANDARLLQGN